MQMYTSSDFIVISRCLIDFNQYQRKATDCFKPVNHKLRNFQGKSGAASDKRIFK